MKILFLGDVMGRAGRQAIIDKLPKLRSTWKLDVIVVNGENATSGAGLAQSMRKLSCPLVRIVLRWVIMRLIKRICLVLLKKNPASSGR